MKHFLFKLFLYAIPALLILMFPVWILYKSCELISLDDMCKVFSWGGLVGSGYSDCTPQFKSRMAKKLKPDILVLGSSRCLQISHDWFNERYSFYNAGGSIAKISDCMPFLKFVDYKPVLLILNLDQFFFRGESLDLSFSPQNYSYHYAPFEVLSINLKKVYIDMYNGKIQIDSLYHTNNIGMNAIMNHNGFRADGTYYYGGAYNNPVSSQDYQFKDTYRRINQGTHRFEYSCKVNACAVQELKRLLRYCSDRNIDIIFFIPPFAPSVWNRMMSLGDNYLYMSKLPDVLKPMFDEFHIRNLFVFNTGADVGSGDNEFIDGFHGSDKTYLRMLLKMADMDRTILPYLKDTLDLKKEILRYPDVNVKCFE